MTTNAFDYLKNLTEYIEKLHQIPNINITNYILNAVKKGTMIIGVMPHCLRNFKDLFYTCVKKGNIEVVKYLNNELAENVQFVKSLLELDARCYQYLPACCRNNRELTIFAISGDSDMVEYASDDLKMDEGFCEALLKYPSMRHTPIYNMIFEVHNTNAVLRLIKIGPTLRYIPYHYKDMKELFIITVEKGNPEIVAQMDCALESDIEFIKSLINISASCYRYLPETCRENKNITRYAVHLDKDLLQYAGEKIRNDTEFCNALMREICAFPPCCELTPSIPYCTENNPIRFAHYSVINNADIMRKAIKEDTNAFQYASEELRANKEFVKFALELNPRLILFVNPKLWNEFTYLY